jgi:FkbM family methyltransferase
VTEIRVALARIGENPELRERIFATLAEAEGRDRSPASFRFEARWPIVEALIGKNTHRVELKNGLIFEVRPQSRIEKALLLSVDRVPDHVWEPQTTRLACTLAQDVSNVVVGGAYIGDQALPVAKSLKENARTAVVHAFEPSPRVYAQLLRHVDINRLPNIRTEHRALWGESAIDLKLQGGPALTSAFAEMPALTSTPEEMDEVQTEERGFTVPTVTIDDYMKERKLTDVGLIMIDMEGAEQQALSGASTLLKKTYPGAPHIIFEVYAQDWSGGLEGVSLVQWLLSQGYDIFAIRDLQGHLSMAGRALEIIPLKDAYIPNVPHGFNVLATKDKKLPARYGLTVAKNLSPKLLSDKNPYLEHPPKNPKLHMPVDGLGLGLF